MIVDIHCHTAPASPCASDPPASVIARARSLGLGGLALTEHEVRHPASSLAAYAAMAGETVLFCGVELSVAGGRGRVAHFVVLGECDLEGSGYDVRSLARALRGRNCAVVQAHPFRYGDGAEELAELLPVHAIEVASVNVPREIDRERARALAGRLRLPTVAASDAHRLEDVGRYATRFTRAPRSDGELAEEIRAGRVEPVTWNPETCRWE